MSAAAPINTLAGLRAPLWYNSSNPDATDAMKTGDATPNGDANPPEKRADDLFAQLLPELKRLAHSYFRKEKPGSTFQTTALVNEAYVRLRRGSAGFANEAEFMQIAAAVMRHILVDRIRRKRARRHGGDIVKVSLDENRDGASIEIEQVLVINDLLEQLARINPAGAQILEMKYFSGATNEQIGEALKISEAKVRRTATLAYAWLKTKSKAESKDPKE